MMELKDKHRRYFGIGGITVCIESDLGFDAVNFRKALRTFSVSGPGEDSVVLRLNCKRPDLTSRNLGKELYRRLPWAISHNDGTWYYQEISPIKGVEEKCRFAEFTANYSRAEIYIPPLYVDYYNTNGWESISLLPTDQIWLAPLLAERGAVLLHSAAAILNGSGVLFIGHSTAGKSTTVRLLQDASAAGLCEAEILCDDRNIARRWSDGWHVHGTWSHGDVAAVSPVSAPLRAVFFLQQDAGDEITPLIDHWDIRKRLLARLIKPMVTAEWWNKELDVLEQLIDEVRFYTMRFTRSGAIVDQLLETSAEWEYSSV